MIRFIVPILCILLIEWLAFRAVRSVCISLDPATRRWVYIAYGLVFAALVVGLIVLISFWSKRTDYATQTNYTLFNWVMGLFIISTSAKIILCIFTLLNDLVQCGVWIKYRFFGSIDAESHSGMTRVQFFNQIGMVLATLWSGALIYGVARGKYRFRSEQISLSFNHLPAAFDKIRMVHISDMHLGSFNGDIESVRPGFEMIQRLNPDMIVFTGDLVNNFSSEAEVWIPLLSSLNAPLGKFAILGNHDYGDYAMRDLPEAKAAHQKRLAEIHAECGFQLLRNEHTIIEKNGERLVIIGSENWGLGFHQYGDLDKAMAGIRSDDFCILLSHDPTHWSEHVLGKRNIPITLSGHTHGAQMGVELPQFKIKFSPVSVRYKRWGGLYTENQQHLYVNRGFGFLAFPGRVGMPPEITLLELNRSNTYT
jgi:predicted MPP superfamily phosphohydrolase